MSTDNSKEQPMGKQFKVLTNWNKELKNYPTSIPWSMLNEEQAQLNHGQSLTRLNERGGMGVSEILFNIKKQRLQFNKETQADVDELNLLIKAYHEPN